MRIFIPLLVILSLDTTVAEVTHQPPRIVITPSDSTFVPNPLLFKYPPVKADFSADLNTAQSYANPEWNKLTRPEKASYLFGLYELLLKLHQKPNDPAYRFSPRVLVCKLYNESSFDTQIGNLDSSAKGLSQVLDGTADDVFRSDRLNFRSVLPGYEHISEGPKFREIMADDPTAHMELGLAVLESKRRDFSLSGESVEPVLKAYLGGSEEANKAYAEAIYNCALCVKQNKNKFTVECLCKAKPKDDGCLNGK